MKKYRIIIIALMLVSLVGTCASFGFLDDIIPTHIGISGAPDRFGSKYFLLLFVGISVLVGVIMLMVSKSKKVSENYKKYLLLTGCVTEVLFVCLNALFC